MDVATQVEALQLEGRRMAEAAGATDPDTPVPTCPDWVVRDLVRHTGAVHRWATGIVATPRTEYGDVGLDDVVDTWPSDAELVEWFRSGHAALVRALSDAPPDLECFTFLRGAPSPLAHWSRRQAHETGIHRVDTELAAGVALSPFDAAVAVDGVDELLCAFVPRRGTGLRAERPTALRVRSTDGDASTEAGTAWLLRIDGAGVSAARAGAGEEVEVACTVSGAAQDLYLALWNRGRRERLTVEGDADVLDLFLGSVQVR